ncbi:MAG: hypothetical protein RI894_2232 [Bacteroidota bacterium]|jgi:hypothetical protein
MNKTVEKIVLALFQLAGFSVIAAIFLMWHGTINAKIINYFFIIAGLYGALWLLTTVFAWQWLLKEKRFLALFSGGGTALTGGFVYVIMKVMFQLYK